ncbi:MAG: class I SAM-dependent methyltransferase [bacterium]|nr:class I SAM-dependent methyltransferase [bacterium]
MSTVTPGDFTALAKSYVHRTGYSDRVLRLLVAHAGARVVADVGAGTGKLTENLLDLGLGGFAIEPNAAMRAEGLRLLGDRGAFRWCAGSAEETGLPAASVDWVLMGSSFHWTDAPRALAEFHRILRPGGFFTALWNPRDLDASPLHAAIEARIRAIVPELSRVSSGASRYTVGLEERLVASGRFEAPLFVEAPHAVEMTPERYLGAWRSVNDVQAQAGPERFTRVLAAVAEEIAGMERILVPYRTRAWTVRRRGTLH